MIFRFIFISLISVFILSFSHRDNTPKYEIEDYNCFTSIMLEGAKVGYWDTMQFMTHKKDCDEYFCQRIFKVVKDTLIIVKVEDSLRVNKDFVGLKAAIISDTLIRAMLYMDNALKGKSAKRLEKGNQSDKIILYQFQVVIHGDSCKVDL